MKLTNLGAGRPLGRFLSILAVLISFGAYAQESQDERETVLYDPLFWKDELSLRNTQSRKIEQINTEFYETLRQSKDEQASKAAMHEKIVDKTAPAITAP